MAVDPRLALFATKPEWLARIPVDRRRRVGRTLLTQALCERDYVALAIAGGSEQTFVALAQQFEAADFGLTPDDYRRVYQRICARAQRIVAGQRVLRTH